MVIVMSEKYVVFTKNRCHGDIMNISCANCPYRRGYWCFEEEIKNGDV
jgi:hypothetical protein